MPTFETYIGLINKLYKDNPDLKEVQVITAGDDEGNSFHPVIYSPSKGTIDEENQFIEYKQNNKAVNAICLN